jgi:chaperonin GroEL
MSDKSKSVIKNDHENIQKRIDHLQAQIETMDDALEKEYAKVSIARLKGGMAVIRVGGKTATEHKEIQDRVIDAVLACNSAKDGVVRGGGVALYQAAMKVKSQIIKDICRYPIEKILTNAKRDDYLDIIWGIGIEKTGYDIHTGEFKDMYDLRVIDSSKVITFALKNAVSVATTMLQTSVLITELEKK